MAMSFPVSFLVGRSLAQTVGVSDPSSLNLCGVTLAMTGGSPVGVVLTRQLALQRVEPPPRVERKEAPMEDQQSPEAPLKMTGTR